MSDPNWVSVTSVQGELQAELLRGLLEAQGITVQLSEEGVARVYGFTVGPLAEVYLLVPEDQLQAAQKVISDFQAGKFEDLGDQMEEDNEMP
jgi:hypothetical protein